MRNRNRIFPESGARGAVSGDIRQQGSTDAEKSLCLVFHYDVYCIVFHVILLVFFVFIINEFIVLCVESLCIMFI